MKRVAIVGGTKGIGRAVARVLAARGDRVALLGRDAADLAASAGDLAARAPDGGIADARDRRCWTWPGRRRSTPRSTTAARQLGGFDTVVVTAGAFGTQEALEADAAARERVLSTNFTQTIQFCEAARVRLLAAGRRHAVRARLGGRRSRPQAGRALWRDQGGAGVLPRRGSTCAIATPGCAWCWSSRGSSAPA